MDAPADPLAEIATTLVRTARAIGARPLAVRRCVVCGGEVSGRAWFCSNRCRCRAKRRRRAGLPESALAEGGWRGRAPLRATARLRGELP